MVRFLGGDGIAEQLFSTFRLQQSWTVLVGLIGRTSDSNSNKFSAISNNFFQLLVATNHLHLKKLLQRIFNAAENAKICGKKYAICTLC